MIRIYERSLCQSYAGAYRAGIKIGEAETHETLEVDSPHLMAGGTYALGGTTEL